MLDYVVAAPAFRPSLIYHLQGKGKSVNETLGRFAGLYQVVNDNRRIDILRVMPAVKWCIVVCFLSVTGL